MGMRGVNLANMHVIKICLSLCDPVALALPPAHALCGGPKGMR